MTTFIVTHAFKHAIKCHCASSRINATTRRNIFCVVGSQWKQNETFPMLKNSTPASLTPTATIPACNYLQTCSALYSSTTSMSAGVFGWVRDKFMDREKSKQAAKLVDQINLMANAETWTLKMFVDEIDETLSSWRTKIPGMGSTSQLKAAKETQAIAKIMVERLGADATVGDLVNMDRKQKLQLVVACEKPMSDIDMIFQQFKNMEIMHRILRYRKANGKPLPTDEAGLKMAMQQDGVKVMNKKEKEEMREMYAKQQGST